MGERELVQPVWERSAAYLDTEFIADGEVRQTEPAGKPEAVLAKPAPNAAASHA